VFFEIVENFEWMILCYILLAVNIWMAISFSKREQISPYLTVAILISVTLWYLPLFTIWIVDRHPWSNLAKISKDYFFCGYALELIVTTMTLGVTLLSIGIFKFRRRSAHFPSNLFSFKLYLSISCLIIILLHVSTKMNDYLTTNALPMQSEISDQAESLIFVYLTNLALAYSIFMTNPNLMSKQSQGIISIICWLTIGIFTWHAVFIQSTRAAILLPAIVWCFNRFYRSAKIPWRRVMAVILVCVLTTPLTLHAISQLRAENRAYDFEDISDEVSNFLDQKLPEALFLIALELHVKCDSVSTGIWLLEQEPPGAGGWMPIISSLGSIIPRFVWPSKPWPGSTDGTVSGHPSRLVPALMGAGPAFNVGIGVAHIAVWQLGYLLGICLTVILAAMHLLTINALLLSQSLYLRATGLAMLGPPLFYKTLASPDAVVQDFSRLLLVLIPYIFYKVAINLKTQNGMPFLQTKEQIPYL
jgi:hypothetical protein